jgi:hypothetical protein
MSLGRVAAVSSGLTVAALVATVTASHAQEVGRPASPDWLTDPACEWVWSEGGGIGFWSERCALPTGLWETSWSPENGAFVQTVDGEAFGIVVQPFSLSEPGGWDTIRQDLVAAAKLDADAPCAFEPAAIRPAVRTIAFFVLTPTTPDALAPTETGDVPEPLCGPYGVSTHGVRYFMTDLRLPGLAVFIDEGQERPMFDPISVTALPPT